MKRTAFKRKRLTKDELIARAIRKINKATVSGKPRWAIVPKWALKKTPFLTPTAALRKQQMRPHVTTGQLNRNRDEECRKMVLARDRGLCVRCRRPGRLVEVHHIHGKQARPQLRFTMDNLVTLCVFAPGYGGCHYDWAHARPFTARQWLLSRLPKERREALERVR